MSSEKMKKRAEWFARWENEQPLSSSFLAVGQEPVAQVEVQQPSSWALAAASKLVGRAELPLTSLPRVRKVAQMLQKLSAEVASESTPSKRHA